MSIRIKDLDRKRTMGRCNMRHMKVEDEWHGYCNLQGRTKCANRPHNQHHIMAESRMSDEARATSKTFAHKSGAVHVQTPKVQGCRRELVEIRSTLPSLRSEPELRALQSLRQLLSQQVSHGPFEAQSRRRRDARVRQTAIASGAS
jgi:hypothetical protein